MKLLLLMLMLMLILLCLRVAAATLVSSSYTIVTADNNAAVYMVAFPVDYFTTAVRNYDF